MSTETKQDGNGNTIKNEDGTDRIYVTKIIHAGNPENFVYCEVAYSYKNNFRAEYLLSNGMRQKDGYSMLIDDTEINPRNWDMYIDKNQSELVDNVHAMTYDEANAIDIQIRNTGATYYLATAYNGGYQYLHYVRKGGDTELSGGRSDCFGIRPVVEMVEGVYIASGYGTEEYPYVLAKEPTE